MTKRMTVTALMLVAAASLTCAATHVDDATTFLARFDANVAPEHGVAMAGEAEYELVPGRFGTALHLPEGQALTYQCDGCINIERGTVEFWMKPWWQAGDEIRGQVFGWRTEGNNYVRINFVNERRFGVAMNGGQAGETVWHRLDYDPAAWAPDSWHHVAAAWEGGTLRLYIDGELVGTSTRGAQMTEAPVEFEIGPGPFLVDDLRISNVARSDEEIGYSFTGRQPDEVTLLTDFEVTEAAQAMGEIGVDAQHGVDDRPMPLIADGRMYDRGVGLRAPGHVAFAVPEGFVRLRGEVGACGFADAPPAEVAISIGGAEVFNAPVAMGAEAVPFDLPLNGACEVRIEARAAAVEGGMVLVGDPVLTPAGQEAPEVLSRPVSEVFVELQRMRMDATRFHFDLPAGTTAFALFPGRPVDESDQSARPERQVEELSIVAAPGEFEAAQFMLCTGMDLTGVSVTSNDLSGPGGAIIPASAVDVRLLRRVLQRNAYRGGLTPDNFAPVSRFLFPNREFWLPEGHLKQIHLIVEVPEDAAAGEYAGTVAIAPEGMAATEVPLRVTVLPIELIEHLENGYSMYYNARVEAETRPELFRNELRNLRAHGCDMLKPRGTGIVFERNEAGEITWTLEGIRLVLDMLREEGFSGPIPLGDGAAKLGSLLGIRGVVVGDDSEPLHESEEAQRVMWAALADLEALAAEYPEFEFLTQHGDEVLGNAKRLPFIDHSKLVNPRTNLRNYMTVHMMPETWEEPTAKIDEFVDIRCINGHSLEEWLRAGHDFAELAAIGEQSGDELWIYHNMRGAFYLPEWNRILQGVYMWQSPLRIHAPWMWNSYGGSPFDDTDSDRYDFIYAVSLDDRGEQIVDTLHWEACREGYDDMRYIATLEAAIERARERGVDTTAAQAALDAAAAMLPKLPDEVMNVEGESPLLRLTAQRYSGADWDAMRARLARAIVELNAGL